MPTKKKTKKKPVSIRQRVVERLAKGGFNANDPVDLQLIVIRSIDGVSRNVTDVEYNLSRIEKRLEDIALSLHSSSRGIVTVLERIYQRGL